MIRLFIIAVVVVVGGGVLEVTEELIGSNLRFVPASAISCVWLTRAASMSNGKVGEVSSSDMLDVDLFCAKKGMIAQIDVCIQQVVCDIDDHVG